MKSEVFYVTYRDRFYTKDAILASAVLVILGMTVIFHWSVWEFVITEAMIILAFHAGGKNRISV